MEPTNSSYMKTIGGFLAVLALLGGFFGTYRFIDSRYALAEELRQVERSLSYKIADDQRFSTRQEMREIEKANPGKSSEKWPDRDKVRYQELQDQLKKLQDKLQKLQ